MVNFNKSPHYDKVDVRPLPTEQPSIEFKVKSWVHPSPVNRNDDVKHVVPSATWPTPHPYSQSINREEPSLKPNDANPLQRINVNQNTKSQSLFPSATKVPDLPNFKIFELYVVPAGNKNLKSSETISPLLPPTAQTVKSKSWESPVVNDFTNSQPFNQPDYSKTWDSVPNVQHLQTPPENPGGPASYSNFPSSSNDGNDGNRMSVKIPTKYQPVGTAQPSQSDRLWDVPGADDIAKSWDFMPQNPSGPPSHHFLEPNHFDFPLSDEKSDGDKSWTGNNVDSEHSIFTGKTAFSKH